MFNLRADNTEHTNFIPSHLEIAELSTESRGILKLSGREYRQWRGPGRRNKAVNINVPSITQLSPLRPLNY